MSAAPPAPPNVEWIACFGASEPVEWGRVECPLQGGTVPILRCLDCHYLAAVADERWSDRGCQIQNRID